MVQTMTSMQRLTTVVALGEPDRVPIMPISRDPSLRYAGATWQQAMADGEKYVRAQVAYQQALGLDALYDLSIVPVVDEALGAPMTIVEDNAPTLKDPCLLEHADLAKLKPITDIAQVPRAEHLLDIIRRLKEEAGPDLPVIAWISPPFRTACNLRGMANIYLDMIDEPSFVKDLVAFCVEPTIVYAKAAITAGADMLWTSNPTASTSVLSRRYYEEFVTWSTKCLFDAVRAQGKQVLFHICGDWHDRVDLVIAEGPAILHIDKLDLAEAKAKYGRQVALMGKVSSSDTMVLRTPADVAAETLACLRQGAPGGGYILAADCLSAPATPFANMQAMVETGRKYGTYPLPESLTAH